MQWSTSQTLLIKYVMWYILIANLSQDTNLSGTKTTNLLNYYMRENLFLIFKVLVLNTYLKIRFTCIGKINFYYSLLFAKNKTNSK